MMTSQDVVNKILSECKDTFYLKHKSKVFFAPINIALIKYWGKRNEELKLPTSSSLSYSSAFLGTRTMILFSDKQRDEVFLNGEYIEQDSNFYKRTIEFINLFRYALRIDNKIVIITNNNISLASGLASSASGMASLTLAIDDLFKLNLTVRQLSIIARLGSGSACRSIISTIGKNDRFVLWNKGNCNDGFDSYAEKIKLPDIIEDNISMFIVKITNKKKDISSTDAMRITIERSKLYDIWLKQTERDVLDILRIKSFKEFGLIVENNALLMHQAIRDAGIDYFLPQTYECVNFVQKIRKQECIDVFCTIDAGANVKIICKKPDYTSIKKYFNDVGFVTIDF